jgi:hypothetical protein
MCPLQVTIVEVVMYEGKCNNDRPAKMNKKLVDIIKIVEYGKDEHLVI